MKAPLPENEAARLEALHDHQILDTDPEQAFNDLTDLAAHICETPIALISLVDAHRQWFKSKVGIDATETPRDIAFCAHAILQSDVLLVPDTLTDERFASNPLVRSDPYIRFYAGVPLIASEGYALGTLCVIDRVPRQFNAKQVEALRALGRQVITQMELRRYLAGLARITIERQQAQQAQYESTEKLRLALEAAHMGTWDWNIQTNEITWSNGHEQLLSLAPDTFNGTYEAFNACVLPEDRESVKQAMNRARLERQDYNHEFRVVWLDGSIHWIEGKGRFLYDETGQAVRMIGTVLDISSRKQAEEALRKAKDELEIRVAERTAELLSLNQRLQIELDERKRVEEVLEQLSRQNELILNSVGEGLCGLDLQGKITFVNPAAAKSLGYQVEELIGQSYHIILPHSNLDGTPYSLTGSPIYASLRDGSVHQVTSEVFRRKNGSSFPVEYVSNPIREQNAIVGAVVTFKDITDRQQVERMKDEFISVVSHELRTPLTSIHGSLGMLASGLLDPTSARGKRLLEIAIDSTDRLVRLINDILDIERIESGKVQMAKQACDAADLMTHAADVMQSMAERSGVNLSVLTVSAQLWADPDRIIQTLTNLLSNAIKFSPQGNTVWLTAQNQGNRILFQVEDRGRGIPADKLESIFERFQQVDSSDSRNHEGTGLGLAICRSIIQQHGGRIGVESKLGEGSSFYFTLPILKESEQSTRDAALSGPLVLICDDDPSTVMLLQTLLEQQKYRVLTVASGQEAVEQATASRPDVILLDLLMPGMNGWETMAALKQRLDTKDIPIIICSFLSPEKSAFPATGFVDWMVKPLDEASLFQSLKQVVASFHQRVRVLVVEDDNDLAQVLITLFKYHEIEVYHAQTGREAIRLSQQVNPDLLILDLILPDRDGFEVVEWLSQHNCLHSLPLVVYSAKDLDDTEQNRLKLGQTEFLKKGRVTTQEFEQRVMELLQRITQNRQKDSSYDSQTNFGD